jgi:oligopeptide/dipeptide ABC transporter ATP-binding protein
MAGNQTLLSVENLSASLFTETGPVRAAEKVSFCIRPNETFALVGESGCGKSTVALCIMRLIPPYTGKITAGKIIFAGRNLLELTQSQMRRIRGRRIGMVFQNPSTSLNPVFSIGSQMTETLRAHNRLSPGQARRQCLELLQQLGLPAGKTTLRHYPHQLSGGMLQRVLIAMAVGPQPSLLIADEPTAFLDTGTQALVLDTIAALQQQTGMSVLLISHHLGIAAQRAERVAVMYASRIVETGRCSEVLSRPLHPYTAELLKCLPQLGKKTERLTTIPGAAPYGLAPPTGCKFHPRCPSGCGNQQCRSEQPELSPLDNDRQVACWNPLNRPITR